MGYIIGIPDIIMKIYSIIWMANDPISQAEIENALKDVHISLGKTAISVTLKELTNIGAIEKIKISNDRTNYYKTAPSLIKLFQLSMSKILGPAELKIRNFSEKYKDHELAQKLIKEVNTLHSFLKHITNLDYE